MGPGGRGAGEQGQEEPPILKTTEAAAPPRQGPEALDREAGAERREAALRGQGAGAGSGVKGWACVSFGTFGKQGKASQTR